MSTQLLDTPSKHPFSVTALVDTIISRVTEGTLRRAWGPIARLAEAAALSFLKHIEIGELKVCTPTNDYTFPPLGTANKRPELKAELRVISDTFWVRLCTMSDLGFAEAYMYGEVACDDLISLFQIFFSNKEKLIGLNSTLSYLVGLPQKITTYRFLNTISNSRSNISAHYDISNAMFAGFLSKDMTYSCGIFDGLDQDLDREGRNSDSALNAIPSHRFPDEEEDELYDAQIRKLQYVVRKANILSGQRVLEIGCGWGSLAILIALSIPSTTIDAVTLSVHQQSLAQKRIAAAGLTDRITIHLVDYRCMPSDWKNAFDRVVSVEMIESVGQGFLETYWNVVDWALKPQDAVGVVQVITIPEARYERYSREIDFIRKWVIFPGGILPSLTLLLKTLETGSRGQLIVDSVTNIGPHYARTLREWRRRFLDCFETVIVPDLQKEYPDVMGAQCGVSGREEIEVFKRKWIYYFCYCEIGFSTRTLGDHVVTFTRDGCQSYGCSI